MPEPLKKAWESIFPNNQVTFADNTFQMSRYENENRIFLNWTKVPKTDIFY
jgi:hypothetical protein